MNLAWSLLIALALIWGTSFAAMEIGLVEVGPMTMMTMRSWIGGLAIAFWGCIARVGWPRLEAWWQYLGVALIGNCIPFYAIGWGQQSITSSAAGGIMGTMPLVTAVIATVVGIEQLRRKQWLGLAVGFVGLLFLAYSQAGGDAESGGSKSVGLFGAAAVFGAVVCYALSTLIARVGPDKNAIRAGASTLLMAGAIGTLGTLISGENVPTQMSDSVWAVVYLGLLPSGMAAVIYFKVVNLRGPVFLSQVNYLIPIIAMMVGWLIMNEALSWALPFGLGLILLGLYLAQRGKLNQRVE